MTFLYLLIMHVHKNDRPKYTVQILNIYKELIERCWSSDQLSRPKFEEIANELRFNQNYITEKVNVKEFKDYVD